MGKRAARKLEEAIRGMTGQEVYDAVWEEIKRLKFISKLKDLLIQSRKYGYSLLYYITKEKDSETANPLSNNYEITGLNIFDKYDIQKININKTFNGKSL